MNTQKKLIKFLSAIVMLFIFAISFNVSYADWLSDPLGVAKPANAGATTDPSTLITKGVNLIFTISEIAFMIVLLIGGVMYLTAAGNEDTAGKARKMMIEAVIGIIIVFSAWGIGTWVINALK